MEKTEYKISASQFFLMMFVSRIVVTIGLNGKFLGGENMLEAIVSCLLAGVLGLLLAAPIWGISSRFPGQDINRAAQDALGKAGKVVPALYLLYFVFTGGAALGLFHIFLLDTINPEFSAALAIAAVLAVALYGALRGIETVARCAVCVFAVLLCGCALVFGIVAFRFDPENLEPLFTQGPAQTVQGAALFLGRTSVFADMAVLLPMVTGRKKAGFFAWAGGTAAFLSVLLLLLAGCLGPYAATQNFPVFSLSTLTEIRSMQRLDAVFVGVWMMGLVIRLACDIFACRVCVASLCGKRLPKTSVFITGGAILLLALAMAASRQVQRTLLNPWLTLLCTTAAAAVIPLAVLGARAVRRMGK